MVYNTEHIDWKNLFTDNIPVKSELYRMIVESITLAVVDRHSECILFDLNSPPYIVIVDSSEFSDVLKHCLEYFIKEEEYELCGSIRDLIEDCEIEYA